MVQSRRGNSAPTACSTLTGSVSSVQPNRRASRPKWVSTVMPGTSEGVAEHDVGGLAADAGQRDQVVEPARHLAVEALEQGGRELEQRVGLGPEEAGRLDQRLELGAVGGGHRGGVGIGREQRRPDRVDPAVGGLRGQHRDDQQLEALSKSSSVRASG